jgi:hypothetical protein
MTVTPSGDSAPTGSTPTQPYFFQPIPGSGDMPPTERVRPEGGGVARWLIAGVATLLVLGLVVAVILLAGQRATGASIGPDYAPADSQAYAEVRLDLPGDQRDAVVAFMSRFPGFADPSTFEQKVDDTFDQLLRNVGSPIGWSSDIEPWFGGQAALFGSASEAGEVSPSFTAVLSVKDRTRLDALLAQYGPLSGAKVDHEYGGVAIWTAPNDRGAFAVTDEAFIAALRAEDVHAALDVKAGDAPGLATNTDFTAAIESLSDDRLAAFYVDSSALAEVLGRVPSSCSTSSS